MGKSMQGFLLMEGLSLQEIISAFRKPNEKHTQTGILHL